MFAHYVSKRKPRHAAIKKRDVLHLGLHFNTRHEGGHILDLPPENQKKIRSWRRRRK
jgi:hypothetical protein